MSDLTQEQVLKVIRDAGERIADHAATIAAGLNGELDTYEDVFGDTMTPEKQIAASMHAIEQAVGLIRRRAGLEPKLAPGGFPVDAP